VLPEHSHAGSHTSRFRNRADRGSRYGSKGKNISSGRGARAPAAKAQQSCYVFEVGWWPLWSRGEASTGS